MPVKDDFFFATHLLVRFEEVVKLLQRNSCFRFHFCLFELLGQQPSPGFLSGELEAQEEPKLQHSMTDPRKKVLKPKEAVAAAQLT